LVGDSLGMVIQGKENTLEVTIDDVAYHTKAVSRALSHAHLVADMPFLTYNVKEEEALKNAGKLIQAGAQSVKLEGGEEICDTVQALTDIGIPVMGHIGMTPQSVNKWGGFKVQGRDPARKDQLLREAKILEEAGAYAIVLESVPADLAKEITLFSKIPTIGIGAGADCDGQIMVVYDLLGMYKDFKPKFVKQYASLASVIENAMENYAQDIREGTFPQKEHTY
jgi:3-methyl-2-oxobutanoate hydroxymethyltransferase